MTRPQMAPVAWGLSDFEAKVVTARLGADGILWEVRGIVDGMYPMGGIDVLVPVAELSQAEAVLGDEGETIGGEDIEPGDDGSFVSGPAPSRHRWWYIVAIMLLLVAFSSTRLLATMGMGAPDRGDRRCPESADGAMAACER